MESLTDEEKQHLGNALDLYNREKGLQVASVCLVIYNKVLAPVEQDTVDIKVEGS